VANPDHRSGLFPALLKHWRGQRGLSQLDLALAAEVSSRHISFLETGRSSPSPRMVLRLATALGVSLQHVNAMLEAAGHAPMFPESAHELPATVVQALSLLKANQEPYPLIVIDRTYRIRDLNRGALAMLTALLPGRLPEGEVDASTLSKLNLNLARWTFDPDQAQPYVVNFDEVGRALLWRIQREVLTDPEDGEMRALLDDLLAMPTVAPDWRDVNLSIPSDPALVLHLRCGALDLRFLVMATAFQAPQNVSVEQLRIELWIPYDGPTAEAVRALVGTVGGHLRDDRPPPTAQAPQSIHPENAA
jgi:transcriptional regulator with XRE-family HTH domain